jgi:hypothetical protein
VTDDDAISGEQGAYVPCADLAAAPVDVDVDGNAIAGGDEGRVAQGQSTLAESAADETSAISGATVGYVAKPCDCCGGLSGSSGLVDPGDTATGTHLVTQSSAPTLLDTFTRVIPWIVAPLTPGPNGQWYQWGQADTGQQWFAETNGGAQSPAPPDSFEVSGAAFLATGWHASGMSSGGLVNEPSLGGYDYTDYDFGWHLADHGFDVTADIYFEKYGFAITDINQFTLQVHVAATDQLNHAMASITYEIRRSSDPTLLVMTRGGSTLTISLPTLAAFTDYRIRWQVDGPKCNSRAKIWPIGTTEPAAWDGETTLLAPMRANAAFGATIQRSSGGVAGGLPQIMRLDNISLAAMNVYGHATVVEDSVTQIGPRQYQLKNSYLPGTIAAFIAHGGYPLVVASRFQALPNILEDDAVAGIFSFPATIDYSPAYNPTITTGTPVTAAYIVPPNC